VVDVGEDCDGEDLGGADCSDAGFDDGTLACNSACGFDTFDCIVYICGNNVIDPSEFCDGDAVGGGDCASEGFPLGGEIACGATCEDYDVSGCLTQLCGNDTIEGNEDCDGTDLNGQTCESLGLGGGVLACSSSCQNYSISGCDNAGAQYAYVANDTSMPNSITAYAIAPDGALSELAGSPFSTGGDSSFSHHPNAMVSCGDYMYIANYNTSNISAFVVEADGTLAPVPGSPFPQTNVTGLACNDDYLFTTDFGSDVGRFSIEDDGSLTSLGNVNASPSVLGITLDPGANRLVVAGYGSAINVFDIDAAGDLTPVPGSPFIHGGTNHSAAVSPGGNFVASEGNNSVRLWAVADNGSLSEVPGSPFVDNAMMCEVVGLAWAPDEGRLFAGHRGCFPGMITVYDVAADGTLSEVAGSPFQSGGDGTVGLTVDPTGIRLFASHENSQSTSVLDIGNDGTLTAIPGSPFPNPVFGNHPTIVLRNGF
jgi:6-phosphogluconolactonase (cycloisomerase 2 family)